MTLTLVRNTTDIRDSLGHFLSNAPLHLDRTSKLLRHTSLWVHDPSNGGFGPGKFVGYCDMTFARYEQGRVGSTDGARFDGHTSRIAIEAVIGATFAPEPVLQRQCQDWGEQLLGAEAFGGADANKWEFVLLPMIKANPFQVGIQYTKNDIYRLLNVPEDKQHGHWDTGYAKYEGQYFIFCGIGVPGRTGHNYNNHWLGDDLFWSGKENSRADHASIRNLLDGSHAVNIFTRTADRDPFTYQGTAVPKESRDTVPVIVIWSFALNKPPIEPGEVKRPGRYYEGSLRNVQVNAYERNPSARAACIAHHGKRCQVCNMDFGERYGQIGIDFIHVHHKRPLSGIGEEYEIDPVDDLVPVCPNCHAMLHRVDPPITIGELRRILSEARP